MYGWDPAIGKSWFSDIWNAQVRGEIGLLVYREGDPKPLDRIEVPKEVLEVTPEIQRTLDREVLLKRHQTRLSFASGTSTKFLLAMVIIMVGLFLFLYLGGANG